MSAFVLPIAVARVRPYRATSPVTSSRFAQRIAPRSPLRAGTCRMGLQAVESYDGAFGLDRDVRDALVAKLTDPEFSAGVAEQADCEKANFAGDLFQPVPYSVATPLGMPRELETFARDPNFTIINIPPTVMFEARCFKPSRLCAVFRLYGVPEVEPGAPNNSDDTKLEVEASGSSAVSSAVSSPPSTEAEGELSIGELIAKTMREGDIPLTEAEERELDGMVV